MAAGSSHPDADFITQRQKGFADAFQSGSVEAIMGFMSDSIDFSDYGSSDLHLNKPQVHDFFTHALNGSTDVAIKTLSVSGDKHFSTWEWALSFKLKPTEKKSDGEAPADASGLEVKLLGISATWWDEEGKLMVRNHDYALPVKEFEWEKKEEEIYINLRGGV